MNPGPIIALFVLCIIPLLGVALGWWMHARVARYGWRGLQPDFGRIWRAWNASQREWQERQKRAKQRQEQNERTIHTIN